MKTNMVTAKFTLRNEQQLSLELGECEMQEQDVDCKYYSSLFPEGCLFLKDHPFILSKFNLTGVTPYALLGFDESGEFTGVTLSTNETQASFSAHKPEPVFVLMPMDTFRLLHGVKHLEIVASTENVESSKK